MIIRNMKWKMCVVVGGGVRACVCVWIMVVMVVAVVLVGSGGVVHRLV